jgi:PucR family transcriptional regulator, purine catabolism regulatory protein
VLTIREVLQVPAVRSADPQVLAGAQHLSRQVRWVHTTELADIGPLLRGGDLVLTTGIALPDHDDGLTRFALSLADSEAAGLFVELGRRWTKLPAALVEQCEERGLPLVALRREVRFAAVAQAVGERLVDDQLAELRAAQRVHDTFTELSISEAGPADILAAAQRLSRAAVVLETAQHQIVDYLVGPSEAGFLDDWERRSRNVRSSARTGWDASNGWVVTRIGRPERGWGRLVIGAAEPPSPGLTAVAERAAAALAMHRLHDRTRDSQARRVHHELLIGLLADPSDAETHRRAELAGLPATGPQYVGLALRPVRAVLLDDLVAACLRAAEVVKAPVLASVFESDVRALLAIPGRGDAVRLVDRWAAEVSARVRALVTAGSPVDDLATADRTLLEASQVLAALPPATQELSEEGGVRRLDDVHLRGLLTLLADDARVSTFADRELAPLRDAPELTRTLRALVEHPGSKSAAAAALNISRPVLYDRITRLERVLGLSLDDAEIRTSLHVALLADDLRRS